MNNLKQRVLTKWQPGRQPVFISGDARSGTSWLGSMLAAAKNVLYYHEPANPYVSGIWDLDPWFRYFRPGAPYTFYERTLDPAFHGLDAPGIRWLDRKWARLIPGYQVVIKDVTTFMNLEWINNRYNPQMIVILRHPCAVVLSQLREARVPQPQMEIMLAQDALFEDHLQDYRGVMQSAETTTELLAALWAAKHKVVSNVLKSQPHWRIQYYEDLCDSPIEEFKAIYNYLGLNWTRAVENIIDEHSSAHDEGMYAVKKVSKRQAWKWKQEINQRQLDEIKDVVCRFELPFYNADAQWTINSA